MSKFALKKVNHVVKSATVTLASSPIHNLLHFYLRSRPFSSSSSSVKSIQNSLKQSSFTVYYLISSCGFTPERALSTSKFLNFKIAAKPDSVLTFLKDHGFTQTQISKVISGSPHVLISNPDKTLLPKLKFLKSKGFSDSDIAMSISKCPQILMRSLENQLIPSFNLLSNLLQSHDIDDFKRCVGFLLFDLEKHGITKIDIFKQAGVPVKNIWYLLANHPRVFMTACDKFRQVVDEVKIREFDPMRLNFSIAVKVLSSMPKSKWDRKVEIYKNWGWSEKAVAAAFQYSPMCMALSEDKITSVMEFWVNEMGWESSYLATIPTILSMSLEKRIIPRCKVYQALLSKGYKKPCGISLSTWLTINEISFLKRISDHHEKEASWLLKLYNEKLSPSND